MTLPPDLRRAIVEHGRRELPNEACGLLAGDAPAARGGRPTRWLPARNVLASPYRYEIHPDDLVRLALEIDDAGEIVWAIVHSHVGSAAVPSAADLRAWSYPDAFQLVVSLAGPGEPTLRGWRLVDSHLEEVALGEAPLAIRDPDR
ncbi:MAG TPA: M67 family metallopeptidase [Candidatus Binatus sp.]|nr:M67 family metallopeptidase [Candidatus Binatus sp.]